MTISPLQLAAGVALGLFLGGYGCRPDPVTVTEIEYVDRDVPRIVERAHRVPVPERITVFRQTTDTVNVCMAVPASLNPKAPERRATLGIVAMSAVTNTPLIKITKSFVEVPVWNPELKRWKEFRYRLPRQKTNGLYLGAGYAFNAAGLASPVIQATLDVHLGRIRFAGSASIGATTQANTAHATVGVRL